MSTDGGTQSGKTGRVVTGVAGAGLVGSGMWMTLANGPWWVAVVMVTVFVLCAAAQALSVVLQALSVVLQTVIPQNSRDRLAWSQTVLDYRLARRRDRAAVKLAQTWIGGLAALPLQAVIADGPPSTRQECACGAAGRDAGSP